MHRRLKYYLTAFGPDHYKQHPVEDGVYPHVPGLRYLRNLNVMPGDVMILYCASGYPSHDQEAPGIGVVTSVFPNLAPDVINYQYFGLDKPLGFEEIKGKTNFSLRGNWVREIASASFRKALLDRQINWP